MELVLVVAVFAAWMALQLWVLPKLGIPTCLSGQCRTRKPAHEPAEGENEGNADNH